MSIYKQLQLFSANNEAPPSEEALRDQEVKIMELGEQLKDEGKTQEMTDLIQKVRTVLKFMSKAKAAKLVRKHRSIAIMTSLAPRLLLQCFGNTFVHIVY